MSTCNNCTSCKCNTKTAVGVQIDGQWAQFRREVSAAIEKYTKLKVEEAVAKIEHEHRG